MLLNPLEILPDIRKFLLSVRGKKILHLSDTPTSLYPAVETLLREIRPDYVIHTGDCADEYKAGRKKEDIPAYREAVPELFRLCAEYAGEVWVVPGNNDIREVLTGLPGITVLPEWSRAEICGLRLELSHFPNPAAFQADFALYGHSAGTDAHYGTSDGDGPVYLNGNFDFSLIDAGSKRFLRIPYRKKTGCMRIFIARHGQPQASSNPADNPDYPAGDPSLTGDGILQSKYLAAELHKRGFAGKIYSSPFLRAIETARETARMTGGEIFVEARLREISKKSTLAPDFYGETLKERRERIPEISAASRLPHPWWDRTPETGDDVLRRVAPFLDELLEKGEDAALFAHGAVVNAAIRYLTERAGAEYSGYYALPPRSNAALTEFRLTGKRLRPVCINGTDHLPSALISTNAEYAMTPRRTWLLTQIHLHAYCEEKARFRSHAAQAAALGYDVIYITEHDTRMNYMPGCITSFRPEKKGPAVNENGQGWYLSETEAFPAEERDGRVFLPVTSGRRAFFDGKKKQQVSLLAGVTLKLEAEVRDGGSLQVDIRLSQRPDLTDQHLIYTFGAEAPLTKEDAWSLPLPAPENHWFTMPLSRDVLRFDPEFGEDQAFLSLTVSGDAEVGELRIERKYTAEALRNRMKEMAERVTQAYGVKVIPCFELSFGKHHNCFSADVPVIDYARTGYIESDETGTAYLRSRGALFAENHPFSKYKRSTLDHETVIQELADELVRTRAEGARLIEVGFPEGRYGFSLEEQLRLWDLLSMKGLFLIGYGDSDSHNSALGWRDGNCFGTWIWSERREESAIEEALRAGLVSFGDPNRFHGTVFLTVDRKKTGAEITCAPATKKQVKVKVTGAPLCTLRLIVHGRPFLTYGLSEGETELTVPVTLGQRDYSLIRAEILDRDGRIICCTNPVFLKRAR